MTSEYKSDSPYFLTPIKNKRLGYFVDRPIKATEDDIEITLTSKHEFAPDLLAEAIYGVGYDGYWWVIPRRNGLEDPIWDLKAGVKLMIPPKSVLDALK